MKLLMFGTALMLVLGQSIPADAVVCAAGVYHAGCAGVAHPYGYHPYAHPYGGAAVVGHPVTGAGCFWRAGVRVCR
jgi:hypothetical protein